MMAFINAVDALKGRTGSSAARGLRPARGHVVFLVATSDGLNDRFSRPLGTDFANVYAAGSYVLDSKAAAAFDPPRQYARE